MCITWPQFGIHLDCFGPNFSPTQRNSGPSWARGSLGPSWAQPKTILHTQCDALKTLALLPIFQIFLVFDGSSRKGPTLGLPWAQLRRQMPPHRTKLHTLSPACAQRCPSCAMLDLKLGPSWSQLARVRRKLRPSSAQVGSRLAQLEAKGGQV